MLTVPPITALEGCRRLEALAHARLSRPRRQPGAASHCMHCHQFYCVALMVSQCPNYFMH